MKQKLYKKPTLATIEKLVSYRATSSDGKFQANASTEKEALRLLESLMKQ